jgi:hypothetical protein
MRLILQENKDYSDVLKLNYNGSIQAVIVDASTNKLLFSYSNNGLLSDLVRKINFDVPRKDKGYAEGNINVFLDVYQYNPNGEKIHFATISPENPLTQEFEKQISTYPYSFRFADDFTIALIEEIAMKNAIEGGWSSVDLDIDEVASQIDELEGTIKISQQKIAAIRAAASETTLRSADVSGAESKFVQLIRETGVIDVITTINDTYIKLAKYTKLSTELSKKAQAAKSIYNNLTTYANIVDPVNEITIMAEKMFDNGEDAKRNGPTLVSDGVPTSIYYTKEETNPYEPGTMLRVYIVAPSKPLYSENYWWYVPSENQVWQIDTDGFVVKQINMEG